MNCKQIFFPLLLLICCSATPVVAQHKIDSVGYTEVGVNVASILTALPIVGNVNNSQYATAMMLRFHPSNSKLSFRLGFANTFGGSIGLDRLYSIDKDWGFLIGFDAFANIGVNGEAGLASGFQFPIGLRYNLKDRVSIGTEAAFVTGFLIPFNSNNAMRATVNFGMRPASGLYLIYRFGKDYKNTKS